MTLETKMQIEALKQLEKQNSIVPHYYESYDGWVYFVNDGYMAVRIPEKVFFLDKEKLHINNDLCSVFEIPDKELELTITDEMRVIKGKTAAVLRCDEFETYISSDHLKLFSKGKYKISAKNEKSAIHFMLGDTVFGVVMPIYAPKKAKQD